jgi:maltooligosyltrehalose trehalohydrolase
MLFMGQEYGASNPFLYFVDFGRHEIGPKVRQGRQEFLGQFPSYASDEAKQSMFDPNDPMTFERSKLDRVERGAHGPQYRLYRDLLRLRREDLVFSAQSRENLDGAVLSRHAFAIRYFEETGCDRLVVINLGADLHFVPAPEPLLAPPPDGYWGLLWSSDHPQYEGPGIVNPLTDEGWHIPAESATVFRIERDAAASSAHNEQKCS